MCVLRSNFRRDYVWVKRGDCRPETYWKSLKEQLKHFREIKEWVVKCEGRE